MITYRDSSSPVRPAEYLNRLSGTLHSLKNASLTHDQVIELLIDFGAFESALVDWFCPYRDSLDKQTLQLRELSVWIGRLLYNSWNGREFETRRCLESAAAAAKAIANFQLPRQLNTRVAEGYAYYGLAPEMYLEAAVKFYVERRPEHAVCIGIRSIGTSLSGVVAGTLEELGCGTTSLTLRPRGHAFDRTISISNAIEQAFASARESSFLVIDEGPGISGSSFGSVAELLSRRGIEDSRIILFPSWNPDPQSLLSENGRAHWARHKKYYIGFNQTYLDSGRLFPAHTGGVIEISAGEWRRRAYTNENAYPAVHPQHERRKFLVAIDDGKFLLYKFAGLGSYGSSRLERAKLLQEYGFIPPVRGLESGFLVSEFVEGTQLSRNVIDLNFPGEAARYLSFLAKTFQSSRPVGLDENFEMIRTNVNESFGPASLGHLSKIESMQKRISFEQPLDLDGRMFPHEWIQTGGALKKTDAVDHFDDHFFPGAQDLAWDVVSLFTEFNLCGPEQRYVTDLLNSQRGIDLTPEKMSYYRVLYLAFRTGYSVQAEKTLGGSEDGRRFRGLYSRYSRLLQLALEAL